MSKKMKKFFSLMLVALVMLGVTACEQDVTIDTPKSEGLSFYAEIAMTRADLEQGADSKWTTVWEGNETLYVNEFAFTNTESEPSKFTCTTEGVDKLVGQDVTIKMENNSVPESGKGIMIEQTITAFDPTSTITLTAKNAFFRFTYTGDVTFTLSQPLFVVDGETTDTITVTADGDTWVSVLPGENVTLSYSVIDIKCKETTLNIVAGKIFNLKELAGPDSSMLRYELVTDASQLGVGDYVIIAAADSEFALSTTQNNNNRGQVAITKGEGSSIIDYVDGVEVLTLKKGTIDGTYSFYTGEGYLYAASKTANHLKTQENLNDNGSWEIKVASDGTATLTAQGDNTRNSLLYNKTNSLFSCYANSSESITAVALYVGKNDPRTALETPVLNATLEGKIITLSWDYITNAKDYTVTFGNNEPMTVVGTTTTFDGEWNTSYEIMVVANPVDDTKYIQSSATTSVAIGSDPSSSDKVDILNCALTGVTGTSYTEWSDKTVSSTAVYAGNSAGGNESIQLRSSNSNSGIVTTKSGGKAKKISVTWNSNTSSGRTLNIYGKNTAYAAATDLYDDSTQGTLLGTIVCGTSTELTIDGVYQYIGMRSNGGAMYIDEIQISWAEMTADDEVPAEPLAKPSLKTEVTENTITVSWDAITGATGYKVSINDDANTTKTIVDTRHEFTGLTAGTKYTISVVALGDGETATDSEVATIDAVTTAQDVSGEKTTTYNFSEYTAGAQYADNEEHVLDDVLTITTTDCHFTTELRIYSSTTYNGYAIGKLTKGTIKKLGFNAGNKSDTLNVYGSTDGVDWTLINGVSVTSAYKDYIVDFGGTNYKYFKLDVAGANQIRVKSLTLTYAE